MVRGLILFLTSFAAGTGLIAGFEPGGIDLPRPTPVLTQPEAPETDTPGSRWQGPSGLAGSLPGPARDVSRDLSPLTSPPLVAGVRIAPPGTSSAGSREFPRPTTGVTRSLPLLL